MKALLLMLLASSAFATPYVDLFDPAHPQPIVGAAFDFKKLGNTEALTLFPVAYHASSASCATVALDCIEWAAAIGASFNAGKATFDAAPMMNVLPFMQSGLLLVTPASWEGLRAILEIAPNQPVTFSLGPDWEYQQVSNKGYLKCVTAAAFHF